MLTELHIKNFKSIHDLRLEPGRVTVLIGENGSGKSNILEALAFAAGAAGNKLDHEFLVTRGIRVTEPRFMRSAFEAADTESISLSVNIDSTPLDFKLQSHGEDSNARWFELGAEDFLARVVIAVGKKDEDTRQFINFVAQRVRNAHATSPLADFLLYSPENTALRTFEHEGQILPLGIKGEGLFALLKQLSRDEARMAEIRENLRLLDWFEDLRLASDLAPYERNIQIRDRYLDATKGDDLAYFGQRSANEGFLFLLFYFALFVSPDTPKLFAVDNIDASLNPKLCAELMRRLVALAKRHDKQVLITTHNPAVLDGLDLHDDEQRLLVVHRNSRGHTRARRIAAPKPLAGEAPVKLSEAFMRGLIGGLPQNF